MVASAVDVPTELRDRLVDAATSLALDDIVRLGQERSNCYDELVRAVRSLPPTPRRALVGATLNTFFPHSDIIVRLFDRLSDLNPYAPTLSDGWRALSSYAAGLNAPTALVETSSIDGPLAGAKAIRSLRENFDVNNQLTQPTIDSAKAQGAFDFALSASRILAILMANSSTEVVAREGLSLDVGNAVHRQMFQAAHALAVSGVTEGNINSTFSSLLGCYEAGLLPVGTQGDSFAFYRLIP